MKNKLKLLVVAVLVFVMAFALTACGSTDIEGTWELTECSATMDGVDIDMVEMGMGMTLEIKEDGTFEMTATMPAMAGGGSETATGEWEFKNGTLTLSAGDVGDFLGSDSLKLKNGKLVASASQDGMSMNIVFEKE